jgi:hypothetical protein
VQAWVTGGGGNVIAAQKMGEVFGSDTPGPRQDDWSQPGHNEEIKHRWKSLRDGLRIDFHMQGSISGFTGVVADILAHVTSVLPPDIVRTGVLFVGEELFNLHLQPDNGDPLRGLLAIGDKTMILGPNGLIPAIYFGLIGASHRPMRPSERAFADRVFAGSVDWDRVIITNLANADTHQKFTIPSFGNTILVNMGQAYEEPVRYVQPMDDLNIFNDYASPGSVFIHELTHAWQIAHNSVFGVICGVSDDYNYGADSQWPKRPWSSFNNEKQARIVDDWYGTYVTKDANGFVFDANGIPVTTLDSADAMGNQAFRFIRDHIRTGTL